MKGIERRRSIAEALLKSDAPISGSTLAKMFGVSRQVIVQDMALLRAEDKNIISTSSGYMIFSSLSGFGKVRRCIKIKHSDKDIRREMEIITDGGGKMLDIILEHPIYGQISVDLFISSKKDIDEFLSKSPEGKTLMSLTGGVHFHTIEADSEETLDKIENRLSREFGSGSFEKAEETTK